MKNVNGIVVQDAITMSSFKMSDVEPFALKALNSYSIEELKGEDELTARMFGGTSVFARRVGRTRIVFLCYNNGKLLGSMRVDTAKA